MKKGTYNKRKCALVERKVEGHLLEFIGGIYEKREDAIINKKKRHMSKRDSYQGWKGVIIKRGKEALIATENGTRGTIKGTLIKCDKG